MGLLAILNDLSGSKQRGLASRHHVARLHLLRRVLLPEEVALRLLGGNALLLTLQSLSSPSLLELRG